MMTDRATAKSAATTANRASYMQLAAGFVVALGGAASFYGPAPVTGNMIAAFVAALLFIVGYFVTNDHFKGLAEGLRRRFQFSGDVARILIVIMTIGGTFLAVDKGFDISFIPPEVDPLIKRLAPILVTTTIVLFGTGVVSYVMYDASARKRDVRLRWFEIVFYLSAIALVFIVACWCMGSSIESWWIFNSTRANSGSWPDFVYPDTIDRGFRVATAIAAVWLIGSFMCIFSRITEWFFRDGRKVSDVDRASDVTDGETG